MKPEALSQARNIMQVRHFGILGTISVKIEGFPFGSVVPYCLDGEGRPIVLISTIAQHTKNISQDDRCSLTVTRAEDDVQATGRLCLIGHMKKLPAEAEAERERYYRHFPKARSYGQAHNFSFYYLDLVSVRYIGGFGAIYWIEPDQFLHPNPFHGKAEERMVDHMNADHRANLVRYLHHYKGIKTHEEEDVRMVGIDEQGFDVFVGDQKVRFEFEKPIQNPVEARETLVAMARAAE